MPAEEIKAKKRQKVTKRVVEQTEVVMREDKRSSGDSVTDAETMEIIEFMRENDGKKDKQIESLVCQLKNVKQSHDSERQQMSEEYRRELNSLAEKLAQKSQELEFTRTELKLIRDFSHKRNAMKMELEEAKELMAEANREYKDNLVQIEENFSKEKVKLQAEANQKISQLAAEAHNEVLANLDETTKSVYKNNVRLKKSLQYYVDQVEELKRWKKRMEKENKQLKSDRELDEELIRKKVAESRHDKNVIKELQERVSAHERALTLAVQEFESQKRSTEERSKQDLDSAISDVSRLQKMVQMKTKEMNRVKILARNILDQRSDVECFFLEGLEFVRKEITVQRAQSETSFSTWNDRNRGSHSSAPNRPRRNPGQTQSEPILNISSKVDISELTWEQKETVLRYLFARMNKKAAASRTAAAVAPGQAPQRQALPKQLQLPPQHPLLPIATNKWSERSDAGSRNEDQTEEIAVPENSTFLTEPSTDGLMGRKDNIRSSTPLSLVEIGT